jgi:monoamine oxidase
MRCGTEVYQYEQLLKAFSLTGRGRKNVHICGEAYSDYQGFIEGALSSAEETLRTLKIDPAE